MNKLKNKKGFTLVEILAVIVILAILVLIAIPKIFESVEKSKKNSFRIDAESLLDAATNKFLNDQLKSITTNSLCYSIDDLKTFVDKDLSTYTGRVVKENKIYKVYIENGTYYIEAGETGNFTINEYTKDDMRNNYSSCE